MNLHILPDSKFSNTFYSNLIEAGLSETNKLIIRTKKGKLTYVTHDIPFAALYSSSFEVIVGDVNKYDRVFIHQFSPLMYRWVARHSFRELNWMIWGTDLYNLPFVQHDFYEPVTRNFVKHHKKLNDLLYLLKVWFTNMPFRKRAYSKVDFILTWMQSEFAFAKANIPNLRADHRFFFYENQLPYEALDNITTSGNDHHEVLKIIVGNSGTPTNNHLDVIRSISESGIRADLYIPLTYGDKVYIEFLKKNITFYNNGKIEFIEGFMEFNAYVRFLMSADALVMNHIRPQGYGNILMMMYLGKPVFLNDKNLSLPDLIKAGLAFESISQLKTQDIQTLKTNNKANVTRLLSHENLLNTYKKLFGK